MQVNEDKVFVIPITNCTNLYTLFTAVHHSSAKRKLYLVTVYGSTAVKKLLLRQLFAVCAAAATLMKKFNDTKGKVHVGGLVVKLTVFIILSLLITYIQNA